MDGPLGFIVLILSYIFVQNFFKNKTDFLSVATSTSDEKQNKKLILTNSDLTKFSFSIQAFVDKSDIMIHGSDICLRHLLLTDNILVKTKSRLAENQINIGGWEIFGKTSLNFRV